MVYMFNKIYRWHVTILDLVVVDNTQNCTVMEVEEIGWKDNDGDESRDQWRKSRKQYSRVVEKSMGDLW